MEGGFVRVYRRVLSNPAFRSEAEAMAFVWMVLRASWKDCEVRYKGRPIALKRGQLAVSVRDMASDLERSKDWAVRFLQRLSDRDMIATVSATGVTVITICNYDTYQASDTPTATVPAKRPRQHRDSTATQNKEGKEREERKKEGTAVAADLRVIDGGRPDYAFEGVTFRLTKADYERWRRSFPDIPDLTAALQAADDYYRENPPKDGKVFFRVSKWMEKANREAKEERRQRAYGDEWW